MHDNNACEIKLRSVYIDIKQLVFLLLPRYAKFLVKYPYVNIIVVLLMFIWAGVIGFVPRLGAQDLPNFTQPTKVTKVSCGNYIKLFFCARQYYYLNNYINMVN